MQFDYETMFLHIKKYRELNERILMNYEMYKPKTLSDDSYINTKYIRNDLWGEKKR